MVRLDVKNKLKWVRVHKWRSLLLLIVALVAGYFVYDKIALELNKRAFQNARVAIDIVYADIIKEVGMPDNFKRESECSKSYFGPYEQIISCSVDTDFVFGVKDQPEADNLISKIKEIIKNKPNLLRPTVAPQTGIYVTPAPGYENTNSSVDYYKTSKGLLCIFKYVYDSPSETFLEFPSPNNNKVFYVTSGCAGNARQEFYPSTQKGL